MPITITVPGGEFWDSANRQFIYLNDTTITLEHSLLSVSKWEAKWKRCFLSKEPLKREQFLDYVRCMTLTQNVKPEIYSCIPDKVLEEIVAYIQDPMTATRIKEDPNAKKEKYRPISSEELYYDLAALNIPFSVEKWHLNRLLMLIAIFNEKNKPKKKMSLKERRMLNESRRKALHTRG